MKNVSESSDATKVMNPTFELAYWYYGLQVAQTWRQRLGLAPEPKWADVLAKLSKLPVADGKYLEIETFPTIYNRALKSAAILQAHFLRLYLRHAILDLPSARHL